MTQDRYKYPASNDTSYSPARAPYGITPSDTVALPVFPKALRCGVGGTLILRGVDGETDVTLVNVLDGETIDIQAKFVRATGTTCTHIVALA